MFDALVHSLTYEVNSFQSSSEERMSDSIITALKAQTDKVADKYALVMIEGDQLVKLIDHVSSIIPKGEEHTSSLDNLRNRVDMVINAANAMNKAYTDYRLTTPQL